MTAKKAADSSGVVQASPRNRPPTGRSRPRGKRSRTRSSPRQSTSSTYSASSRCRRRRRRRRRASSSGLTGWCPRSRRPRGRRIARWPGRASCSAAASMPRPRRPTSTSPTIQEPWQRGRGSPLLRGRVPALDGYWPGPPTSTTTCSSSFPALAYREQATQRMFDIANEWLDDTRAEMEEANEKREGKRWFVHAAFHQLRRQQAAAGPRGAGHREAEQVR